MPYELTITLEENYIRVHLTGELNYRDQIEHWKEIVAACQKNNCYKILGSQYLTTEENLVDAYEYCRILREAGITDKHKIAWADLNFDTFERTKFIETILIEEGGFSAKLFQDVEEAKEWLLDSVA